MKDFLNNIFGTRLTNYEKEMLSEKDVPFDLARAVKRIKVKDPLSEETSALYYNLFPGQDPYELLHELHTNGVTRKDIKKLTSIIDIEKDSTLHSLGKYAHFFKNNADIDFYRDLLEIKEGNKRIFSWPDFWNFHNEETPIEYIKKVLNIFKETDKPRGYDISRLYKGHGSDTFKDLRKLVGIRENGKALIDTHNICDWLSKGIDYDFIKEAAGITDNKGESLITNLSRAIPELYKQGGMQTLSKIKELKELKDSEGDPIGFLGLANTLYNIPLEFIKDVASIKIDGKRIIGDSIWSQIFTTKDLYNNNDPKDIELLKNCANEKSSIGNSILEEWIDPFVDIHEIPLNYSIELLKIRDQQNKPVYGSWEIDNLYEIEPNLENIIKDINRKDPDGNHLFSGVQIEKIAEDKEYAVFLKKILIGSKTLRESRDNLGEICCFSEHNYWEAYKRNVKPEEVLELVPIAEKIQNILEETVKKEPEPNTYSIVSRLVNKSKLTRNNFKRLYNAYLDSKISDTEFLVATINEIPIKEIYPFNKNISRHGIKKPKALIVRCEDDHNASFYNESTTKFLKNLREEYSLTFTIAGEKEHVKKAILENFESELLIYQCHGSRLGLHLGKPTEGKQLGSMLGLWHFGMKKAYSKLPKNSTIYLESCLTGKGWINFAKATSYLADGRRVFAAAEEINSNTAKVKSYHPFEVEHIVNHENVTYKNGKSLVNRIIEQYIGFKQKVMTAFQP